VPLYWFILTISPIMIGLTSYVNQLFSSWIDSVSAWHVLLIAARYAWGFGLIWLLIVAVYALIPNSVVKLRPVCAGAFVATLLLWFGKHTFGAYLGNAFSINQLYGSLGLVPLFMFWVYLMWLAILFGLEVSAILQMLHGRSLDEMNPPVAPTGLADPVGVLTLVEVISEQFVAGRSVTSEQLVETTALPSQTVNQVIERLIQDGWLHRVGRPEGAVSLARPLDQMKASVFLELGYEMIDRGDQGRSSALTQQLRAAQQRAADGITLSMLISSLTPRPSSSGS
jgi:membrane protein